MRVALPKGRLLDGVQALLGRAGLTFSASGPRDYRLAANEPGLEAKLLKVRAIPQLLALDRFQVGFCGLDLVEEAGYEQAVPLLDLGLNRVQLVVAAPAGQEDIVAAPPRRPLLVATEYERIADRWALAHNLAHITIQTWGSTEAYAPEDADLVFDCTETGATLAANGLVVIERLLESSTHLVASGLALERPETRRAIEALADRLRRVLE